ncbi:MAG: LPS export ABC transporter periplasmic protein LptC [Thiobacillaceae bacterium]
MIAQTTAWLPLTVVAAMAALAYWLNQLASQPLPDDDAAFRHTPDLIVENFVATAFDPQGHPRYALAAAKMVYFTDDETTELTAPRFQVQSVQAPAIRAESARGFVSTHGEHIHLLDRVRVSRAATAGAPELLLTTEYLQITPEAQTLRTDRPVELRQGDSRLTANSLVYDARARSLDLKGNVRGIYVPR